MPALLKYRGVYWKRFPLLMSYSGSRDRLRKETLMAILDDTSLDIVRGFCFVNLLLAEASLVERIISSNVSMWISRGVY